MLTDDEKRELIANLRKAHDDAGRMPQGAMVHDTQWRPFAALYNAAEAMLEALEGTLTEPEWEYRYAEKYGEELYTYGDFETAAEARAQAIEDTDIVVKRRTSGPWIEVPDV